ncbi:MAG: hypothetical protein WC379_06940 [Methanoregula sp.]|jgi:hypothetical protein
MITSKDPDEFSPRSKNFVHEKGAVLFLMMGLGHASFFCVIPNG